MVRPFGLEPSTIQPFSVEGSPLDIEPSMISTSSVEGSPQIQFYVNAGRRNDVISQNIYENGAAVSPFFCFLYTGPEPTFPGKILN